MSRCFPFPPPGYMRNGSRSEALIESIKLRKETEKPKKDRKEKKEKKEKKREKKEKKEKTKEKKERKHKEGTTSHSSDGGKKFKLINEIKEPKADGTLQKGEDCENDQLERSGITEELDQAVSSVEPCCLSDSTQSSKRKRSDSQSSHDHGSTIKIRLSLRKHREPEESSKSELKYEVGSSSATVGIAGPLSRENIGKNQKLQCLTNTGSKQVIGNSDCKVLQNNLVQEDAIPMVTNKPEDESQGVASLYKSLLQFPPLTSDGFDVVDEDWLFSSVQADARPVSKKPKFDSDMFQCSKPLWPRAQYLPAVEVYALPYTVPF